MTDDPHSVGRANLPCQTAPPDFLGKPALFWANATFKAKDRPTGQFSFRAWTVILGCREGVRSQSRCPVPAVASQLRARHHPSAAALPSAAHCDPLTPSEKKEPYLDPTAKNAICRDRVSMRV